MRKAVLFGNPERIAYVYSSEVLSSIRQRVSMPEEVFTKARLEACPDCCKEVEFLFTTWGMEHFSEEEIHRYFPSLKAVFYAAGSVQHFAREFLQSGISVFSAWCANGVPVAEYTVSQIVLANKGFYQSLRLFKEQGREAAWNYCDLFPGTFQPTAVGLIGAG